MKIGKKALILNKNNPPLFGLTDKIISEENMRKTFSVQVQIHDFDYANRHYRSVEPLFIVG